MSLIQIADYKLLSQKLNISNSDLSGIYLLLCRPKNFYLPHILNVDSVKKEFLDYILKDSSYELIGSYRVKKKISKRRNTIDDILLESDEYETFIFKTETIKNKKLKNPILFKIMERRKGYSLNSVSSNLEELNEFSSYLEKDYIEVKDYDNETNFGILMNQDGQTYLREMEINDKVSQNLNLELNYGKSFLDTHKKITDKLKESSNGLFLFHGASGTGKTTYIKYLARIFGGEKMFIFIPTSFIDSLVSPAMLPILLERPNSVLVLEDAEKAVISRENGMGNESLVSSLLNIGDGILGSMLNISIILTFNTSREKIDKALLRKGRLHYEYKFEELGIEDAQNLVSTFNKTYVVKKPMSLAEIYNIEHDNNHIEEETPKMGFGFGG